MFVAYFDFYLLLICIMLWLFAANKVVYNTGVGWEKLAIFEGNSRLSRKRCEIGR